MVNIQWFGQAGEYPNPCIPFVNLRLDLCLLLMAVSFHPHSDPLAVLPEVLLFGFRDPVIPLDAVRSGRQLFGHLF